jgi:plasmid stabilization system protein ParE
MVEIIWTKLATDQLERALIYIKEEQGKVYANIVFNKIIDSVVQLETHPKSGQIEPSLKHKKSEYRYLVVWSYKIIYRVGLQKVVISRVFHTSQNPSKIFNK